MKLKKLQSLDFVNDFMSHLETDFEKELFTACLRNYASHGNPLRFHNFAFSIRELIKHIIEKNLRMINYYKHRGIRENMNITKYLEDSV